MLHPCPRSHKDPVQCISYNPLSLMLVSCSLSDFGLWSPEQKNVTKYSVPSRVNGCTWTTDGLLIALGLMNGTVSIRNKVSRGRLAAGMP